MGALDLRCSQCSKPLALADRICTSCGTPVPETLRMGVLLARVEQQAEAGLYAEAARSLEPILAEFPEAKLNKVLWRKRGGWLARSGRPELLDNAESALAESLRLDDNDDLSHQLWIDVLNRRGQLEKARAWYKERLQLNSEDAMATRQLAILRLTADFKITAPPKSEMPPVRHGWLIRIFLPGKWSMWTAGFSAVFSLIMAASGSSEAAKELADAPELAGVGKALMDPTTNIIIALICLLYIVWGLRRKRG